MKWFPLVWTAGFCGIPAVFIVVGTFQVVQQKEKLDTFVPVEAVVLSTRVETVTSTDSDGHTSTSYKPVINYSYAAGGRNLKCDAAFPKADTSGSSDWANSIVRQFPKDKPVTAYYNPDQPDDAFLIRELSYEPYVFTQFPMLFLLIGVLVWTYSGWGGRKVKPPTPRAGGGFLLRAKRSLARRRWTLLAMTALWYGVGTLSGGHYLSYATEYETAVYIVLPIFAALGLIPAGLLFYNLLLWRTLTEPLVMTQSNQFRLGGEFSVLVALPIKTEIRVNKLQVGLTCDQTTKTKEDGGTSYSTSACYQKNVTLAEDQDVRAGEPISGSHTLAIPTSESPSNSKEYPLHDWYVDVLLDIAGSPDYRGRFPITVEG